MITTLDSIPTGCRARVTKILSIGKGIVDRLYQLGIVPGVIVEIVANYGYGPVVVKIHGSETAIGRGIARKIVVEKID